MLYIEPSSQRIRRRCLLGVLIGLIAALNVSLGEGVKIANAKDFSGSVGTDEEIEQDRLVHDLAIKLKKEFADDLVSDLFATNYGLEKVARVWRLNSNEISLVK